MIFCYSCAAVIGLLVALIELVSKYGTGNSPRAVFLGWPQFLYYAVNAAAGAIVFFVSETLGNTHIFELYTTNPALAILKSCGVGLVSMFALRSSLYSIEKPEDKTKVDLGPAQILNVLNRYLNHQIDQVRGKAALTKVASLMEGRNPDLTDLSMLCLAVPESISSQDMLRIRKTLDTLLENSGSISAHAQAIAMGLQIQKEVGIPILECVLEALQKSPATPLDSLNTVNGLSQVSGKKAVMLNLDQKLADIYEALLIDNVVPPANEAPK